MRFPRSFTALVAALSIAGALGVPAGTSLAADGAAAPGAGGSDSGGAPPDVITLPGPTPIVVHVVGNPVARAAGDRVAIAVRTSSTQQGGVRVTGTAPAGAGATVRIERLDSQAGWTLATTVPVRPDGSFAVVWHPRHVGVLQLRAVAGGGSGATDAADAAATPQVAVNVYRRGVASWYDPVGATTACGVVVGKDTIGVAHRTLPCGTPVLLYYRGRTLVAPVIDRGPYVHGRTWDLTLPTFRALGGASAGLLTLGALAQAAPAPAATPARRRHR
jgi:rare lipoprotein A